MKVLIKKILKESEWFDELNFSQNDLPFEVSQTPMNRPKIANVFVMKTTWEYGDSYLREEVSFKSDDDISFQRFINVCKFYIALFESYNKNGYERWQDVSRIAKSVGLGLGSYDEESIYGTPKDVSDFIFGGDYPATLDQVEISYFDKGGVEYPVRLKDE
jgi:hypothetical protein